jgi:hypothetical protein
MLALLDLDCGFTHTGEMNDTPTSLQLDSRIETKDYSTKHVYETWESVAYLSTLVSTLIQEKGDDFDYAIIIGRGGFGPGNIIVRRLGFSGTKVLHIGMNSYIVAADTAEGGGEQVKVDIGQVPLPSEEFANKKGLIIDEVCDTGDSLALAKSLLKDAGFSYLKTAVLHWKDKTSPQPDYLAKVVNGWVHYPWEEYDNLGEKLTKEK